MAFQLESLADKVKDTTLYYGVEYGEPMPIKVSYKPEILELKEYDAMVGSDEKVLTPSTVAYMQKVIVSWDITTKEGPLPITEEGIGKLGQKLSQWLITELFKDSRPNAQTQTQSNNGSKGRK